MTCAAVSDEAAQLSAAMIAELDARLRALRRVFIFKKWKARQHERACGRPSIGLPLIWTNEQNVTPRYGRNNPLRYQKTNESPPRLDQTGSRL
ncbi:MAG: hypothetical protein KKC29_12555 [Alphaproteobacteria bacterium]|nr:hypothetical protein [Alphaproteobacteria bacterium]MBU2041743.1 hypothetical protein [Alphaproteobacteria bacterium]MBU2126914.1 hypothetical protein [Alphaproteobacteria bacterium]MBU2208479.1 hypothetical protein [Alphaproteobacteria bacterium]MBU2291920.1 hypothetical protein [Alphaproteobacteria bacterium]